MSDETKNAPVEDMGQVILQAAEVIGSKAFIKAHINITVASDQYKMFTAEINLSQGADIDPTKSADDQRNELVANVIVSGMAQAELVRAKLQEWRAAAVPDAGQNQAAGKSLPAGPAPKAAPKSTPPGPVPGARDRNQPRDLGLLMFSPKVSELNYGDTFAVLADRAKFEAKDTRVAFYNGDQPYPTLTVSAKGGGFLGMWESCFAFAAVPTADTPDVPFGVTVAIPCRATTPPNIVQSTKNPFINVVGEAYTVNPEEAVAPGEGLRNAKPIPQPPAGFEDI